MKIIPAAVLFLLTVSVGRSPAQIVHLDQDFDGIPEGISGRYGASDTPKGRWAEFGNDGIMPAVQGRKAISGNALRLQRAGDASLQQHLTCAIIPITEGFVKFDFKALTESTGGLTLSLARDNQIWVGIMIDSNPTGIRFFDGVQNKWIPTNIRMPTGEWTAFRVMADSVQGTYSAFMGTNQATVLFQDKPCGRKTAPPSPINSINSLGISPTHGGPVYLDDLNIRSDSIK